MLHTQQEQAITFLDSWLKDKSRLVACLQGYAGTGKTWLVGYWVQVVQDARAAKKLPPLKITIVAPTNKALDVLRSKVHVTGVSFCTVDAFLGNRIKKNDDGETELSRGRGQENPDLLLCDEASMVKKDYDIELRRRGVKLLYIGDPAQLPPINEDISSTFNVPNDCKFLLTEVVRYDGAIIKVATMLRQCIETKQIFTLNDMKAFRDTERTLSFIHMDDLYTWALNAVNKGMDARIVAFTNADVDRHNSIMHDALFPGTPLFGAGEQVIVNETFEIPNQDPNSEETDMLYNGEMLTVVSCVPNPMLECGVQTYSVELVRKVEGMTIDDVAIIKGYTLDVALDGTHALNVHKDLTNRIWTLRKEMGSREEINELIRLRRPLNKLAPLRHHYSCTVHKSQGSTYDVAFCDWSSIFRSRDRARMMYVGSTRPSKFLVLAAK